VGGRSPANHNDHTIKRFVVFFVPQSFGMRRPLAGYVNTTDFRV